VEGVSVGPCPAQNKGRQDSQAQKLVSSGPTCEFFPSPPNSSVEEFILATSHLLRLPNSLLSLVFVLSTHFLFKVDFDQKKPKMSGEPVKPHVMGMPVSNRTAHNSQNCLFPSTVSLSSTASAVRPIIIINCPQCLWAQEGSQTLMLSASRGR